MAIWLFRAGANGEYENKFLSDNRIYLTWDSFDVDLKSVDSKDSLYEILVDHYDLSNRKKAINWGSQIWPIAHRIKIDDWIVLPSKINRTIHFGKVIGDYVFDSNAKNPYFHYRDVDWFATDIPRDNFEQDILYSLGAFMTVCKIHRNDAENRIKKMANNNWNVSKKDLDIEIDESEIINVEEQIYDQISNKIIRNYKGHKMEELIEEILKAKGFVTYRSPEGSDNGVDILASAGELGFEGPRICVQIKTKDIPVDRPTMDQLIGTMANHNADYGLLVSWNGFKTTVQKEIPKQFFKVRLWDSKKIIQELFNNYENLSEEIKTEIPLKRIWILNQEED